jgi:iron complex outermembrane receptor protein
MKDRLRFPLEVRCLTVACLLSLGLGAGMRASAQSAPASATSDSSETLAEVVVTAEKRTQNLQTTPITAQVLSEQDLENKHVDNLQSLQLIAPSLSVGEAGVTESVNIRGIGLGVSSPAAAMGVALYRDGVFQGPLLSSEPLFDMADVQVLRGPQGTFVGSNSTGGAILFKSKDPDFNDVNGYIQLADGNYGDVAATGAINTPISDTLAARIAFNISSRNSFFKETGDVGVGGEFRHPGNSVQNNLRLSLEWRPNDNLTILSKTAYNRHDTDGLAHVVSPANPYYNGAPLSFNLTYNVPDTIYDEVAYRQSLQADYKFDDGTTLRAIAGYTHVSAPYIDDFDSSSSPGTATLSPATGVFNNQASERTLTQEVDLISPSGGKFDWTVGAFHFWDVSTAGIDITEPSPPTGILSDAPNYKEAYAGFGQVEYKLLDDLQVLAGLRYTQSKARDTGSETLLGLAPFPIVLDQSADESDSATTGKVGVNWTVNSNQYVYAFGAKGYKSGGINGPASPNFAPETVYDYELGLKSSFLDSHVRTQINSFYMDYKNLQLTSYIPPPTVGGLGGANGVLNAGQSTIWGIEAQIQARLGGLGFDASISSVNSKLGKTLYIDNTKLPGTGNVPLGPQCASGAASNPPTCFDYGPYTQNLSGGPNPYSPKLTANAGAEYDFKLGHGDTLAPRIDYTFISSQYQTILVNSANYIPSHSLVNASLTYGNGPWQVQAYGTNLANTLYIVGYTYGPSYFLGNPRQFGIRVTRQF